MNIKALVPAAVLAGFLMSISTPVICYAGDAPKTKADCEKAKGMKWDDASSKCVKK